MQLAADVRRQVDLYIDLHAHSGVFGGFVFANPPRPSKEWAESACSLNEGLVGRLRWDPKHVLHGHRLSETASLACAPCVRSAGALLAAAGARQNLPTERP